MNSHRGQLCLNLRARSAANVLEHIAGLFLAIDRGEVAGTIGEELDPDKKKDGGNALEGENEAPPYGGQPVVDELQAEGEPVGDGNAQVVGDENVSEEGPTV